MAEISTKPYMLRAIYEWCTDNGYTPHIAVSVDAQTQVPMQFVRNGEIVLNISFDATSGLKMDNDLIHFSARFGGVARQISVPVANVIAIYAQENNQGMAFEVTPLADRPGVETVKTDAAIEPSASTGPKLASVPAAKSDDDTPPAPDDGGPAKKADRPTLKRIK
ncbi:MAG: ClpXP protease specificity-enhancing factor [Herbaspirillum sp.]|jgi:stringent starvation protein B|nr:ClpXP protease specificity-enhancing factor [Herbaspirillum sp.]